MDSRVCRENQKERVLMVHNFYQIGGGEHTVFENEQRLLKDHGHYVKTYTRDNKELNASIWKKILLPFTTVYSFKTYRDIKKIIKADKIDVVHCHNTFPLISPSVYYAAWKCGVPVVQTIHNFRLLCADGIFLRDGNVCEDCLSRGLKCGIKHKCYRNSKIQTIVLTNMLRIHRRLGTYKRLNCIFLSDFNKSKFESLLKNGRGQQFIKPNFEYISDKIKPAPRDGSYVFVGILVKYKGIDFLVDNWVLDKDLYIFGSGELEEYVKEVCKKNPRIHYMGFQSHETVCEYIGKAEALVFSSECYEGFPMVLIEAFAFGTPVVCTDLGNGACIVTKEKAGVTFPRRDREGLLQAVKNASENFDYYSSNAKEAYENRYVPDYNYQQLKNIYEAVLNESEQS